MKNLLNSIEQIINIIIEQICQERIFIMNASSSGVVWLYFKPSGIKYKRDYKEPTTNCGYPEKIISENLWPSAYSRLVVFLYLNGGWSYYRDG